MQIRAMKSEDWSDVSRIYKEGIDTNQATFETDVPPWDIWDASYHKFCRIVVEVGGQVVGWAALSPVSKRPVYRGVAEVSIYIGAEERGHGVGLALMNTLIEQSEQAGIWSLYSSMFPENEASVALHEKCGFRMIGSRERIAQHHSQWRDTALMERRSQVVGV
jgi:phosphinothricin acetyltransferase